MSIKHIIYTAIKTFVPSSSSTDRRSQQPSESSQKSLTANRSCDCVTTDRQTHHCSIVQSAKKTVGLFNEEL